MLLPALDRGQARGHLVAQGGKIVGRDLMLAGQAAQVEQSGLDRVQPGGVEAQRLGGFGQLVLRLARFDHGAVQRLQHGGERFIFACDPVEPAGGLAQLGKATVRAGQAIGDGGQVIGQARALLHGRALLRQSGFLAGFGREFRQFGDGMVEIIAVARSIGHGIARLRQIGRGGAPGGMSDSDRLRLAAAIGVKQRAVAAGIEQAAIVMLAVDFDQRAAQIAQQRGGTGLVVDEGAAATIGLHRAADQQRFAGFDLDAIVGQQQRGAMTGGRRIEAGGNAGLRLPCPDQAAIGAGAERQPQRIEQDRLARAGFTGEDGQAGAELQVQRLDQHDIADGKRGQHGACLPAIAQKGNK